MLLSYIDFLPIFQLKRHVKILMFVIIFFSELGFVIYLVFLIIYYIRHSNPFVYAFTCLSIFLSI